MSDPLAELSSEGVAIWLDDLSRKRLVSGGLAQLRDKNHVVGVTSNPTIFAAALSENGYYTEAVRDLAVRNMGIDSAALALTTADVRWACDVMRPAYGASDSLDGRVSIEVDPRWAHDTEATIAEATALWWMVDRPNLFIKIPATVAGLPAITATLAAGISVNVTLIFSLDRYEQVMEAFLAGLEQAQANGHNLAEIESVASFFVSRVDTEVDTRLEKIGTEQARQLLGQAAIANARLAYQRYERVFSTNIVGEPRRSSSAEPTTSVARWHTLAAAGGRPQRPLWASTGVKNPSYADTRYVVELVAPGTVNTMPEATLNAVAHHGEIRGNTITGQYTQAQQVLDELATVGVDYNDVVQVLEDEGVAKFDASWRELLMSLEQQLAVARAHRS